MKILFITSSRLGDAVLSTGVLDYLVRRYPGARITVACGPLAASLFEGLPGLDAIIPVKKQSWNRHWFSLWKRVAGRRWDIVVDLRDSAVSRLIWARQRFIHGRAAKGLHKVEQNAAVLGVSPPPVPVVFVSAGQAEAARGLIPDGGPVLAIGPAANWIGKTWPQDRFIALLQKLTAQDGILPGARVAVFAAPGEDAIARPVLDSVPENRRIDMIARADPGTAAACLQRCALYIGNDSGLMHCAAAARIPTFGLFGPSWPEIYRPWGDKADYARTRETFTELIDFPGYDAGMLRESLMVSLDGDSVCAAIEAFWKTRNF
jgi:heptosyltransferase-3